MSKKLLSLLLLALSCAALLLMTMGSVGQKRLSQLYVSWDTWNELIAARQEFVPSKDQTTLFGEVYFNGYTLAFDQSNQMLMYSLIEDDPTAYDPFVKVAPAHISAQVAVMGGEITDEMIRNNESIQMMVYTPNYYAIYQLKCTTLPILEVEKAPWEIPLETVHTKIKLFDNRKEATKRTLVSTASIHIRGGFSRMFYKKSYKLSLQTESAGNNWRNRHESLLGLRQDDDWILNAMYTDKDKIRDVFSTNLWYETSSNSNEFAIINGTKYRYVEVFYGEQYWGMYALCNPIDEKQVELKSDEHMYRKYDAFVQETEIDFEKRGPIDGYEYRAGNLENPDWEPLRLYYHTLLSPSTKTGEKLYTLADIENSIDLLLFLNLIQGVDHAHLRGTNAVFNLFLTAKRSQDGTLKILYTPWDMDRTWGYGHSGYEMDPSLNVVMDTNIVTRLMELGDEQMAKRLINRYWELRESTWSEEYLESMLLDLENDVFGSGAYAREANMWPLGQDSNQYIGFSEFIDYVYDRLWYMDDYIDTLSYDWGF